jgi:hypothetical protein
LDVIRVPDATAQGLAHEDEVDACSGALEMLNPNLKSWGFFKATRPVEVLRAYARRPQSVAIARAV